MNMWQRIAKSELPELDFLCISTTGWDEIWGSRQQIMLRLARSGHRVLYVERQIGFEHLLRYSKYREKRTSYLKFQQPVRVQENLWRWQPSVVVPGRYYSQALNRIGQSHLAAQIHAILPRLDFDSPVLWLYPPHSAPLIGNFKEVISVYHCIERFSGDQRGIKKEVMTRQENDLLTKVDLVFVHSHGLQELYNDLTSHPIEVISSAADIEHFQRDVEIHPKMSAIPEPQLVVMGTLDSRIDFELLRNIAKIRPDWHLVLIGQLINPPRSTSTLLSLPNVHYLGQQPFEILPSLLKGAKVGLIPYRITDMTRYINPLKAYEYLACGLPVISTELPELFTLSKWIKIVSTINQDHEIQAKRFVEEIETAILTETSQIRNERRQFACKYNWDVRVSRILEVIWSRI
jgi:glycosyltransferase involved in cell wall biosynthesis